MPAAKISKRVVDSVAPAADRDTFLWDSELKGFGLKVTAKGARSYVLQYRVGGRESVTQRLTIGKHGSPWTPESARERARVLLHLVATGADPRALEVTRRRDATDKSVGVLMDLFIERYAKANQPRSWRETKRIFDRDVRPSFGRRLVTDIARSELAIFFEDRAAVAPASAKLMHAMLRKFFRWCVERGVLDASPMAEMRSPSKVASRERVLNDGELRLVWQAATSMREPWSTFYRFLILTGQRREETASASWQDIRDGEWLIPAGRAKNGRAHIVPLSVGALELLKEIGRDRVRSGLIFTTNGRTPISGYSKSKRELDMLVSELTAGPDHPMADWRVHDLRRTLATGLQRLGVRLEVTEAVLNHVSGSRAGIVGVYQRHDWLKEKGIALTLWDGHVQALFMETSAKRAAAAA